MKKLFRSRASALKDCVNLHVPSATDRFSIGTSILLRLKHIDQWLSHSDQTSRSDVICENAKMHQVPGRALICHGQSVHKLALPCPAWQCTV